MVLHAHFKKYIITLGVWFLMYPRRPPRPPVWSKTRVFLDFFCYLPLAVRSFLPNIFGFRAKNLMIHAWSRESSLKVYGFFSPGRQYLRSLKLAQPLEIWKSKI